MLTIGGKKVFRSGHWHGGGDWDAEDVYERLSFSWNDLGTYIGTHWFIGTLVHIPVHIGTHISTYWFIGTYIGTQIPGMALVHISHLHLSIDFCLQFLRLKSQRALIS